MDERFAHLRLIEALLFASAEPLGRNQILRHLPEGVDLDELMDELAGLYANRGVNLVRIGARWAFRTAPDVAPQMQIETTVARKPTRAAVETLAIIAYHQPVTRGEIEEIRGVALSRGTLDTLLEAGWIRPRGRRRTPGKPVTWGTTDTFLDHFGLDSLDSLPGVAELKAAGLIDTRPAATALSARGHLLAPDEEGEDIEASEDEADEETPGLEDALAEDFGEDLLPEEAADEDVGEAGPDAADPNTREAKAHDEEADERPGDKEMQRAPQAATARRDTEDLATEDGAGDDEDEEPDGAFQTRLYAGSWED
jgi:segregation and condensation protein B